MYFFAAVIIGSIVIVLDILLKHPLYDLVPLTCILHSSDFVKKIYDSSRNKVHFCVEKIAV